MTRPAGAAPADPDPSPSTGPPAPDHRLDSHEPDESPALQGFIRKGLGCACPPAVLRHILAEPPPLDLAVLAVDWLLKVGGRLLVLICRADLDITDAGTLARLGEAAAALRDAQGFHRVRIVLPVSGPAQAGPALPSPLSPRRAAPLAPDRGGGPATARCRRGLRTLPQPPRRVATSR